MVLFVIMNHRYYDEFGNGCSVHFYLVVMIEKDKERWTDLGLFPLTFFETLYYTDQNPLITKLSWYRVNRRYDK